MSTPGDDDVLAALGRPANPARPKRVQEPHAGTTWVSDSSKLHCATEWDKFHREDLALRRAIESNALAADLFDVCSRMDAMFGFGDGRLLLRAAARGAGVSLKDTRMPGVTRKAVGLSEEPGGFLRNFKAYAYGLHVREGWRKEGHTGATAEKLFQDSTQLLRLEIVSFALLLRDIMGKIVAPWALLVQSNSVEPWLTRSKLAEKKHKCQQALDVLHGLRQLVRVLVLLRQWVPLFTLRHLQRALFSHVLSTYSPCRCLHLL